MPKEDTGNEFDGFDEFAITEPMVGVLNQVDDSRPDRDDSEMRFRVLNQADFGEVNFENKIQLLSDRGPIAREAAANNEDSAMYALKGSRAIIGVADGMGGHPHGELASKIVSETLCESFERGERPSVFINSCKRAIVRLLANNCDIYINGDGTEKSKFAGTTLAWVMAKNTPSGINIMANHIGDSRIIIISPDCSSIIYESIDHTYLAVKKRLDALDNVNCSQDIEEMLRVYQNSVEFLTNPFNHYVERTLMADPNSRDYADEVKVFPNVDEGTIAVVMSDAVTACMTSEEILAIYQEHGAIAAPGVIGATARMKYYQDQEQNAYLAEYNIAGSYEVLLDGKKVRIDEHPKMDHLTIAQLVVSSDLFTDEA